jgi:hypothetical protein
MPHVIVKLWPGKSEAQKERLAEKIAQDVMEVLDFLVRRWEAHGLIPGISMRAPLSAPGVYVGSLPAAATAFRLKIQIGRPLGPGHRHHHGNVLAPCNQSLTTLLYRHIVSTRRPHAPEPLYCFSFFFGCRNLPLGKIAISIVLS